MRRRNWIGRGLVLGAALFGGLQWSAGGVHAAAPGSVGAVYTLTNGVAGNDVLVFDRSAAGTLTSDGAYSTGGIGTGAGLGSQSALALSSDGKWLFAVNAGSGTISSLQVGQTGVVLRDTVWSGGVSPISITVHGNLVYVLNGGAGSNISGFTVNAFGVLTPIAGSTVPLSSTSANPAQVAFSPNGQALVVTEKGTNVIDMFLVAGGLPVAVSTIVSAAASPFGFAFDPAGHLIVSDAGPADLSSYTLGFDGLSLVTQVPDHQSAPCWVAISPNGKYAYTANAHNGTISGYTIAADGSLTLLTSTGLTASPGGGPLDLTFAGSQFLYVMVSGTNVIKGYSVAADGSLTALSSTVGIPAGAAGIAGW